MHGLPTHNALGANIYPVRCSHLHRDSGPELPNNTFGESGNQCSCLYVVQLYEIIVCVDQREQFDRNAAGAGKSRNESLAVHLEHIRATHAVEARTLPVGDIAWIARCHKEVPGGPPFGAHYMHAAQHLRF